MEAGTSAVQSTDCCDLTLGLQQAQAPPAPHPDSRPSLSEPSAINRPRPPLPYLFMARHPATAFQGRFLRGGAPSSWNGGEGRAGEGDSNQACLPGLSGLWLLCHMVAETLESVLESRRWKS